MRKLVWLLMAALLVLPVLGQEAVFLRDINKYGPTYYPVAPEDLRLLAPTNWTMPAFGNYSANEILLAKVISGEYYLMMQEFLPVIHTNESAARDNIKTKARELCGVPGTPKNQAEMDCLNFFGSAGLRVDELTRITMYNVCGSNVLSAIEGINDQRLNGSQSDIMAQANYAVYATAFKFCQDRFGEKLTVVPPTKNNTIPSGPPHRLNQTEQTITQQEVAPITAPSQPIVAPQSSDHFWLYVGIAIVIAAVLGYFMVPRKKKEPIPPTDNI